MSKGLTIAEFRVLVGWAAERYDYYRDGKWVQARLVGSEIDRIMKQENRLDTGGEGQCEQLTA